MVGEFRTTPRRKHWLPRGCFPVGPVAQKRQILYGYLDIKLDKVPRIPCISHLPPISMLQIFDGTFFDSAGVAGNESLRNVGNVLQTVCHIPCHQAGHSCEYSRCARNFGNRGIDLLDLPME